MNELPTQYLNEQQVLQKYQCLTKNMLKNALCKNIQDFRGKVLRKFGRRNLYDERALLKFLAESK